MTPDMFKGADKILSYLLISLVILVPYAIWKIADLVSYIFTHLQWVP